LKNTITKRSSPAQGVGPEFKPQYRKKLKKKKKEHVYTQHSESGGLQVQNQPGLHRETLSQNEPTKEYFYRFVKHHKNIQYHKNPLV
jgi:hypothetical protein